MVEEVFEFWEKNVPLEDAFNPCQEQIAAVGYHLAVYFATSANKGSADVLPHKLFQLVNRFYRAGAWCLVA